MKYAACVEYHGYNFSGWQAQKHGVRTVQGCVEKALSKVANHDVGVITAGRTDTGVHATHQVIHFESKALRSNFEWSRGANRFLPKDVRVSWVCPVDDEFHARFSALSRSYRYIIYNRPIESAIYAQTSSFEYKALDVSLMKEAGKKLIGKHDFSSFRAAGCQAHSPIRNVISFDLNQSGEWIWFDIKANAFLQHMVRNIAGVLIEVGSGQQAVEWVDYLLGVKDRTQGGITALANGLYFVGVDYPEEFKLPSSNKLISYWANV